MASLTLKESDSEDIEDVLVKIEKSFNIKFAQAELKNVKTFGEVCDIITNKINLANSDDCTSQQAFYKLRNAIAAVIHTEREAISPDSSLLELLPKSQRRKRIIKIEQQIGFKLNILTIQTPLGIGLAALVIAFLIELFFNWRIGLIGFISSMLIIRVVNYFANTFSLKTVGEVAEKMSRENYLKSRRDSTTINRNEVESKIKELFHLALFIPMEELSRETIFR